MSALLEGRAVTAFYGDAPALQDVDFEVNEGEILAVLGPNGAGKTTLLRAISRVVRTRGEIRFRGDSIVRLSADQAARRGIGHVPEGRGTFVDMTVEENLRLGSLARRRADRGRALGDLQAVYQLFPILAEFRGRRAGALSGGQQQMLAIARAVLGRPRLLLLDEPSLGLGPVVVNEVFERLSRIREEWSTTLVVAEQNVRQALRLADRALLMRTGRVALVGATDEVAQDPAVQRAYLGD